MHGVTLGTLLRVGGDSHGIVRRFCLGADRDTVSSALVHLDGYVVSVGI